MKHNTYRDGKVHVLAERCDTCVFHPGNRMHLNPGRLRDLVESNLALDTALVCHSTLGTEHNAVCRGFFDAYGTEVTALRMADALHMIAEDPVPPKED
jgi:hypothetical protein